MMPAIRPSSDLRNHYAEISRTCRENCQPTIITVNGRGDTVLLGYEDYTRLTVELEVLSALAESERDVEEGRIAPMSDTLARLRARYSQEEAAEVAE